MPHKGSYGGKTPTKKMKKESKESHVMDKMMKDMAKKKRMKMK